ncbi:uncharacterized protein YecE (DUF72 family) [Nocardioides cavernae]|uniref:Uncharacterized protein YecE (DUF72 family) n=1 Tax=Nocardioides cavernae TaxID=1921566 RepID=A0A7Y9H1K2_9ACTN|nr:DUF72 domain-containing protein [Nocardioides cavernae]NYE35956.1 uncharacterized protein YecE (DUF72 family) [Nocardioides cavernae]
MARIGISGWRYAGWRGRFYPPGLPQRSELAYVGERLTAVEVNGSFYSLQRASSWRSWAEQVPDDFVFAVKGPRFITHMKKLTDVEAPLGTFLASGVLTLGERLGPLLWQLPPNLGFHPDRLAAFFDLLPRRTSDAASYAAAHHDADKLKEPAVTTAPVDRALHHVLEVRHPSFRTPEFCELLRAHDIGMVVADSAGTWPMFDEVTSSVVHVRLHGDEELYASGYSDAALDRWAEKVRGWEADGLEVHVYFDNDAKVHAPFDALALQERLGITPAG